MKEENDERTKEEKIMKKSAERFSFYAECSLLSLLEISGAN